MTGARRRCLAATPDRSLLRVPEGDLRAQEGELVVHVVNGTLKVEAQAPYLALCAADLGLGGDEVGVGGHHGGLGDGDWHVVRLRVELHEQVALTDAVIVLDQDRRDLPGNTRCN